MKQKTKVNKNLESYVTQGRFRRSKLSASVPKREQIKSVFTTTNSKNLNEHPDTKMNTGLDNEVISMQAFGVDLKRPSPNDTLPPDSSNLDKKDAALDSKEVLSDIVVGVKKRAPNDTLSPPSSNLDKKVSNLDGNEVTSDIGIDMKKLVPKVTLSPTSSDLEREDSNLDENEVILDILNDTRKVEFVD